MIQARNFLRNNNSRGTLLSNALNLFRDAFSTIKDPLYNAILNQITRDRNNEIIDIESLKVAISTFVLLGYDKPDIVKQEPSGVFEWKGQLTNQSAIEKEFQVLLVERVRLPSNHIIQTKQEYTQKSSSWMMNLNCPEYLKEAENHLIKEEERGHTFYY